MRMALLVTHKRITAKISGGRSIDADIKPARFIGYCWIPAAHNAEHFILLCVNFNPGKLFLPSWLEFSNSTFFILFSQVLLLLNDHKTCHNGNRIVHLVSNEVVISIYGMWIPVFIETTELDILGKQKRKQESCREKKPNFTKLRIVYNVQNAWELRPQ